MPDAARRLPVTSMRRSLDRLLMTPGRLARIVLRSAALLRYTRRRRTRTCIYIRRAPCRCSVVLIRAIDCALGGAGAGGTPAMSALWPLSAVAVSARSRKQGVTQMPGLTTFWRRIRRARLQARQSATAHNVRRRALNEEAVIDKNDGMWVRQASKLGECKDTDEACRRAGAGVLVAEDEREALLEAAQAQAEEEWYAISWLIPPASSTSSIEPTSLRMLLPGKVGATHLRCV